MKYIQSFILRSSGTIERMLIGTITGAALIAHTATGAFFFQTTAASEPTPLQDQNLQTTPLLKAATHSDPKLAKGGGDIVVEDGALVPVGDTAEHSDSVSKVSSDEISIYVVRPGDTLSQIAEMFNINAKTILWANDLSNANQIHPGDSLVILPITGVRHVVKKGDTIESIAKKYSGDVNDILAYNQLASASDISVGDTVVVPDGVMAAPTPPKAAPSKKSSKGSSTVASGGGYTNPLPGSVQTQGIHGHNGVDLADPVGTPIHAAAGGTVIIARTSGWNGGYGTYVVIKHPKGTQTLYAHMSKITVATGEAVTQGEVIGYVGMTGRSTGPHLHFEVRGAVNPF